MDLISTLYPRSLMCTPCVDNWVQYADEIVVYLQIHILLLPPRKKHNIPNLLVAAEPP